MVHHAGIEDIDAGGYGRVRREYIVQPAGIERFVEGQLLFRHQQPDPLDRQERRMSLVHVEHGRLEFQCFQCPQAADAEHDLLPHARVDVAAVKRVRDVAMFVARVFRDVRVEQIQLHSPDGDPPNLDVHHAGGQPDLDLQRVAVSSKTSSMGSV